MKAEYVIAVLGVVATVAAALIQRPWNWKRGPGLPKHESLEYGQFHEDGSFAVQDVVKILDLDTVPAATGDGLAVYSDSYLLQRESTEGNGAVFRYGSSGGLTGGCVSHSDRQVTAVYNSAHYPTSVVIAVPMDHLAVGSAVRVTNQLVFTNAFERPDAEDFETHIERPTRSLAMIIKFSPARPCKLATGWTQLGERGTKTVVDGAGPLLTPDGLLLYWRITPTKREWLPIGARYQLAWTWQDATAGQPVVEREGA